LPIHKFLSLLHTLSQGFEKYNRIFLCELATLACHGAADPKVLPSREAVVSVVVVSNRVAGAKAGEPAADGAALTLTAKAKLAIMEWCEFPRESRREASGEAPEDMASRPMKRKRSFTIMNIRSPRPRL
jgi:hypothetical protein